MGERPPAETVPLSTERLVVDRSTSSDELDGWTLRRRADGRVVGRLRVEAAPNADRVEISWQIAPAWRDAGYAAEAVAGAVGYGVDVLGVRRVTALVPAGDEEARRTAHRAGLGPTGRPAAGSGDLEAFVMHVPPVDTGAVRVREATAEEVVGLRQRVLRPHESPAALLASDDRDAVDLAAVTPTQRVVACARLCREPPSWATPATDWWRLRNMATSAQARGLGLGRQLVDAALQRARTAGAERVWCAARTGSAGFYTRCGFEPVTDPWDDPELGPHVGMARSV